MTESREPLETDPLGAPLGGDADDRDPVPAAIGPYRIKRRIATGGMGSVYEAVQENPRRSVALKVVRAGLTSRAALRRFEYEAQILARLRHPGIAQIYEAGTHQAGGATAPYFAMEYVPGARNLVEHAREKGLTTLERVELFALVCDAVHHGHQKGVIHRDLKPGNLLVDSSGQPKVIDFGVARSTDSDVARATLQTEVGQLLGTLQYMSPEQCAADPQDLDIRSDVYSLGVILYELLTGKLPYDVRGVQIFEATRVIRESVPPRPSTTTRQLSGDLDTILLKALEKDRERRYRSAADLADDLRRCARGDPIAARRPSLTYQLRVLARRHRVLFAASSLALAALVLGVLGTTAGMLSARRAKAEAERAAADAERETLRAEVSLGEARESADRARREREQAELARGEAERAREAEAAEHARAEEALRETERARAAEAERNAELREQAYASAIAAADGALRTADVRAARAQLESAPRELRDWEWYALASRVDGSSRTLYGHTNKVGGVGVDASGFRAATIDHSGSVRLWDLFSGAELASVSCGPYTVGTGPLAFAGGEFEFYAPAPDGDLGLWDSRSGRLVRQYEGSLGVISALAVAERAPRIAAGGEALIVWDSASGEMLFEQREPGARFVSVALAPAGDLVAARTLDASLCVYEVESGELAFPRIEEDFIAVSGVDFDSTGTRLASASRDNALEIRDARSGAVLARMAPRSGIYTLDFDPSGERIAVGGIEGSIEIWDVSQRELVAALQGHERFALATFHPDGRRVVSGSWDRTVKVWEVPEPSAPVPLPSGRLCLALESTADGALVFVIAMLEPATGRREPGVFAWSPARGERIWSADAWCGDSPALVSALSADGERLALALADGRLGLLDAATGELVAETRFDEPVRALEADPLGRTFAAVVGARVVLLSPELAVVQELHSATALDTLAFQDSGDYLVAAGRGMLGVWEVESGFPLWEIPFGSEQVLSLDFVGDDRLATVRNSSGDTYEIDVWDLRRDPPERRSAGRVEADFYWPRVESIPGTRRFVVANTTPAQLPVLDAAGETVLTLRGDLSGAYMLASVSESQLVLHNWVGHLALVDLARGRELAAQIDAAPGARRVVEGLLASTLSLAEVLARIRAEPFASETARQAAYREALALDPDEDRTAREIDLVVGDPQRPRSEYEHALARARTLARTSPQDAVAAVRLGCALYRVGELEAALNELERARSPAFSNKELRCLALAFQVMAEHRLGRVERARAALGELRDAFGSADAGASYAVYRVLREAEEVAGAE